MPSERRKNLVNAIRNQNENALQIELNKGRNINFDCSIDRTCTLRGSPLHLAIYHNWHFGVEQLLAHQADIDYLNNHGQDVLTYASNGKNDAIIEALLAHRVALIDMSEAQSKPSEKIECSCCYSSDADQLVSCTGEHIHYYCENCILNLFKHTNLDQKDFVCVDTSEECTADFNKDQLRVILTSKQYAQVEQKKAERELPSDILSELESCPACGCKAEAHPGDVYHCMNPECGIVSCRACGAEEHPEQACKNLRSYQQRIENAMSEAAHTRVCPKNVALRSLRRMGVISWNAQL